MRKLVKYLLLAAVIVIVGYKSVYIKKLSDMQSTAPAAFDAVSFSKRLWEERLPARLDSAVSLQTLITSLKSDPVNTLEKHSNALGIGNIRYALVNAAGRVESVNADDVTLNVNGSKITIATEYVYGNAIRDASGLVDIRDFVNTTDLNNVSEELNKKVRNDMLPAFRSSVRKADSISVTGVIELNREHLKLDGLTIIPVKLTISK